MKTRVLQLCLICLVSSCLPLSDQSFVAMRFPLGAGNMWSYSHRIWFANFVPSVPGATFFDSIAYLPVATVQCEGTARIDGITMWAFRSSETDGQDSVTGHSYYEPLGDSLFYRAYSFPPVLISPGQESSPGYRFRIGNRSFASAQEISRYLENGDRAVNFTDDSAVVTFEQGPVKSYVYPLSPGAEWDYRTPAYPPGWRIHKKVTEFAVFLLGSGDVPVSTVQWSWDMNNDGIWDTTISGTELVGPSGVMQRLFTSHLIVATADHPGGIGTVDMHEEFHCTSFHSLPPANSFPAPVPR